MCARATLSGMLFLKQSAAGGLLCSCPWYELEALCRTAYHEQGSSAEPSGSGWWIRWMHGRLNQTFDVVLHTALASQFTVMG
jgi:hypothetical protein